MWGSSKCHETIILNLKINKNYVYDFGNILPESNGTTHFVLQ
jgi:hypothetical protein